MALNQTFKNIKRLQQIATTFASFGFAGIVSEIGLGRLVLSQQQRDESHLGTPVRLRMVFEELGASFIKLGQMLSLRPDLIPKEYVMEFKRLQEEVRQVPLEDIHKQFKDEFDARVESIFLDFEKVPIGAASIGQVHRAMLTDGRKVVVKVQRPGIEQQVETDLSILFTIANLLDRYSNISFIDPLAIVDEFGKSIRQELDFIHEAQNIETFGRNFKDNPDVVIPDVLWELTGKRIITMTYLDGISLTHVEELKAAKVDIKALADLGLQTFLHMVFKDGFFHGDIHGGNLLAIGADKLGILDMGLVGKLDGRLLQDVSTLFLALVMRDFKGLARAYLKMSSSKGEMVSTEAFARDLQATLEPIMNLTLDKINGAELLMDMVGIAQRHQLQIPQDLLLLFRAIVALESIGRELDPDFDLFDAASDFARVIVVDRYAPDKLMLDLVMVLRDLADMGRDMPGQMGSILHRMEEGKIGVDVRLRDETTIRALETQGWRIASAVMAASGGVVMALADNADNIVSFGTLLGIVMMGLGGLGFSYSMFKSFPRRRR
jgi:ubiquinone biosynthesis protein